MKKAITIAILLTASCTSYAATELKDSQMTEKKVEVGHVSVSIRNGTFAEAMNELSQKADEKNANYYRITSLGRFGMGSDVSATAVVYN